MVIITLGSLMIYAPMAWRETELYWNPDTGNFDLHGSYPTWSLSIAMLSAFAIILPVNIAILLKIKKEQRNRGVFRKTTSTNGISTIAESTDEYNQSGCMPRVPVPNIDVKMTFVLIGISLAFIVLTIPHRWVFFRTLVQNDTSCLLFEQDSGCVRHIKRNHDCRIGGGRYPTILPC